MTIPPYPGWSDPHEVHGRPAAWRDAPASRLSPSPKRTDLAAHDHGAIPAAEEELREELRALMRKYIDAGMAAHRAKVAISVGATVELFAIRSRIEKARYEERQKAQEAT